MKIARIASISRVLLEEGLGYLTGDDTSEPALPEAEAAVRLRHTLERLGPTFVKFGQLLSTRVDLFGEAFVAEMARLQASVPPFSTDIARELLEAELGRPLDQVFESFPDEPVAAASIAQVYRARLLAGGHDVAVKIQRPNLEHDLLSDLDTLLALSGFIDRLVPPYHRSMVHRVAEEYAQRAREELDFLAEAHAIEQFGEVLATLPRFVVPEVFGALCTRRLLVMGWLDGPKLADIPGPDELRALGHDPLVFCRSMLELQLSMCYEHGFVHGDTHPGNLILVRDGRIGLIDFGLHARIPPALRDRMLEVVFFQSAGRTSDAVDAFVQVFQPEPAVDLDAFKHDLEGVLVEGGAPGSLKDHRVTAQLVKGMRVGAKYQLRARSELFVVLRNLTIVEGIILRYAPDADAAAEVKELTGAILRRKVMGPSMRDGVGQVLPQLLLTLAQRPQTAERLLKLERSFVDARSLGEFLRQQDVIRDAPPAGVPVAWLTLGLVLGLVLGLALGLALGG
ncbi:MAG: AarF/ABC1/UbiB kinase family protein [Myxococcales bacterium]|nr:AarF/ABC1/UbiB kinase family protein [Myxococcales bacterium]